MLAGLAALSIPVLIHLLLRRKKKRARFSTLQFFVRNDEQSSQRRKLRNWLLLALRLAICALLVLAFARPYLPNRGTALPGDNAQFVAFVLDQSLSMQATDRAGTKWDRAKVIVAEALSALKPADRAALITCSSQAEILAEWAPPTLIQRRLEPLHATFETGNIGPGLQKAAQLFTYVDRGAKKTVYIISDLQRSACQGLAEFPLPGETEVKIVSVSDLMSPNMALADLQLDGNSRSTPRAAIVSYSDEDMSQTKLDLQIDGHEISSATIGLPAGGATNLDLALPYLKPGWHEVVVRLQNSDALPSDNTRYQTCYQPEPARVWVIETRPSARAFEESSFFVTTALDPTRDATNRLQSGWECEKILLSELPGKLGSTSPTLPCDWIVLPGLAQVPNGLGNLLGNFVRRGGGVLFFVGEGVSANRYNAEFRDLLPVTLGTVETRPDGESYWRLRTYETNHAMFAAFQLPNSGSPALTRFTQRFHVETSVPQRILARYDDGLPAIAAQQVGTGHAVWVNTSVDASWSDWPKRKSFVPWLHGVGQYLLPPARRNAEETQLSAITGGTEDIQLGLESAKLAVRLIDPDGKESALTADSDGVLRDVRFARPGFYRLQTALGKEIRRISVNVPVAESDLSALSSPDAKQLIARQPETRQASLAAGLLGTSGNQREFWRVLLLAVLGLLFIEMFVANRTLA